MFSYYLYPRTWVSFKLHLTPWTPWEMPEHGFSFCVQRNSSTSAGSSKKMPWMISPDHCTGGCGRQSISSRETRGLLHEGGITGVMLQKGHTMETYLWNDTASDPLCPFPSSRSIQVLWYSCDLVIWASYHQPGSTLCFPLAKLRVRTPPKTSPGPSHLPQITGHTWQKRADWRRGNLALGHGLLLSGLGAMRADGEHRAGTEGEGGLWCG